MSKGCKYILNNVSSDPFSSRMTSHPYRVPPLFFQNVSLALDDECETPGAFVLRVVDSTALSPASGGQTPSARTLLRRFWGLDLSVDGWRGTLVAAGAMICVYVPVISSIESGRVRWLCQKDLNSLRTTKDVVRGEAGCCYDDSRQRLFTLASKRKCHTGTRSWCQSHSEDLHCVFTLERDH